MRLLPILLSVAVLAGCAPSAPFRNAAGATPPQAVFDECNYEAMKAAAGIPGAIEQGMTRRQIAIQCLAVKGYRQSPG